MSSTEEDLAQEKVANSAVAGLSAVKYDQKDSRLLAAEARIQELETLLRSSILRDRVINTDDKVVLDGSRHIRVVSDDQNSAQCSEIYNHCIRKEVSDSPPIGSVAKRYGARLLDEMSRDRVSEARFESHDEFHK